MFLKLFQTYTNRVGYGDFSIGISQVLPVFQGLPEESMVTVDTQPYPHAASILGLGSPVVKTQRRQRA